MSPTVTLKRMSENAMSYRFYRGDVCRERDVGIRQEGMPGDLLPDMPSPPSVALCAWPAVVKLRIAHRDGLRREGHRNGHRSLVLNVQRLLVVDDVRILEADLLHLRILLCLLVDDLALDGLELAVEHGLDGRRVVR